MTVPKTPPLIDIGANLTHDSFDEDRDQVIGKATSVGVTQLIVTGASIQGSEDAVTLAESDDRLFATVGIHPHHAEETNETTLLRFEKLTAHPKVKAVGETGLDFFRDFSPRGIQIDSFSQHIELASATQMPMFLHERDAYPTFADILAPERSKLTNLVVHCFTGEKEALHTYLDLDCYIGITGWICDERRGSHLLELIKDIPSNRLLLETDAPYLLPRTIRPKPKSRRNEPHNLTVICQFVADLLGRPYEEIATQTTANAREFFDLPLADTLHLNANEPDRN